MTNRYPWGLQLPLRRHRSCAPAREGGLQRVHQAFLSPTVSRNLNTEKNAHKMFVQSVRRKRAVCWATDHASWMGEERRQCWRDHSRPQCKANIFDEKNPVCLS